MSGMINMFTLPNGLRVAHQQDSATAMVALNLLYNTGARDEDENLTGMAHLIEHLMFSGSAHVSDFDGELQRAGGTSNAWTSNDFTCFYELVPAVNVETAFRIESDRMLSPAISQRNLDIQRSVVIEEFKQQCLNRPYGDMSHYLRDLAYRHHPYRWPVIGLTPEHLQRVTLDDVQRFFSDHYSPSNAVLAVTGNISAVRCRELCEKWMGDIPSRPVAPRSYPREPGFDATRRQEVTGHVPFTAITLAWPMASYGTMGYYAADAITDVLSNGRSSRFERGLLNGSVLFNELDASIMGAEEEGLLMVNARLNVAGEAAEQEAVELIDGELHRILTEGGRVTAYELERAKNKYESQYTFGMLHYAQRASVIAQAVMHGEQVGDTVKAYRSLTVDDINDTAARMFAPVTPRVELIYRPVTGPGSNRQA
ncbi:MAG: insulinase family protein [Clostridiales bacterium]|nr:insulinase family protein [Clostridiales bacterium]